MNSCAVLSGRLFNFGVGLLLLAVAPLSQAEPDANRWQAGQHFTAGAEPLLLRPTESLRVLLAPGSELRVSPSVALPPGVNGLGKWAYALQLEQGSVEVTSAAGAGAPRAIMLTGPRKVAVLYRGGRLVFVARNGQVGVAHPEGPGANLGIGSDWRVTPAPFEFEISAQCARGCARQLLAAPSGLQVAGPQLSLGAGVDGAELQFEPVPGAQSYRLTLLDASGQPREQRELRDTKTRLAALPVGRFSLTVAALDSLGILGPASAPASVRVIGLQLPQGALLDGSRVVLEPSQKVTFEESAGLEMSYDGAATFFPATSSARLNRGRAVWVRLREPGVPGEARLQLVPRDWYARVEIGPARARWPRDVVRLHVQLLRRDGAPAPPLELRPVTTVNGVTVALDWKSGPNGLTAELPRAPVFPGPWVIRVTVLDALGTTLGHDFLEVASTVGLDTPHSVVVVPGTVK